MKALLLAAGLGIRLRPLTDHTPKCLVEINGRPLLGIWLEMLEKAGFESVLVNVHYLPEKVYAFLENCSHAQNVKTVFEPCLLGTAGTLRENRAFFSNGPVLLVHADNYSKFDVREFIKQHEKRPEGCAMTMMTFDTDTPESCGIVELDEKGVVRAFHEKVKNPPSSLANAAVYILEPEILRFLEKKGRDVIDFSTQVLPEFVGKIYTFHNSEYHRDIGTPESYAKAQELK